MMFSSLDTAPHPRRHWIVKMLERLINHAKSRKPGEC
jgi:hypothetical protein